MVEVKLNLNKTRLIPTAIKKVSINSTKLEFVGKVTKKLNRDGSEITVSNVIATDLFPSNDPVEVHIVSEYTNIDTKDIVVVHERTIGKIGRILSNGGNDGLPSCEIIIDNIHPFDYTMEQKTKEELLEDRVTWLEGKVKEQDAKYKTLNELLIKTKERDNSNQARYKTTHNEKDIVSNITIGFNEVVSSEELIKEISKQIGKIINNAC